MNPQSSITLPLGVAINHFAKVKYGNGEHAIITQELKYKREEPNILLPPFQNNCLNFILALVQNCTKATTVILERRDYSSQSEHSLIIHQIPANST